jgi:two-component system phosphate regulon sensor histidine kinase PhoR
MDRRSLNFLLIVSHVLVLALPAVMILLEVPVVTVLAIMALMTSAILFFIRANLKRQYELISKAARRFAAGEYSARVPNLGLDEFEQLGQDLNAMLGKLDSTIGHLSVHREELRLVLGSIEDVLWSQDYEGYIQWANAAFCELFPGYVSGSRMHFREVFHDLELLDRVSDSPEASRDTEPELTVAGRSFILSVSRNFNSRRKVFILHNIDALTQASRMKKDFIANLAHELRTPLTAIKGFAEAMQTAPKDEQQRYLGIIRNHTDRLIHLIRDLEHLITLERSGGLEIRSISMPTFFANISMVLGPEVEAKGLELRVDLTDNLPRLECDPFRLEQVFINLVQNSLRHTERGSIIIRAMRQEDFLRFEVEDTGEGIQRQYLDRVFERFFVADPSRNKGQSGTGLGLAIVKHIVLLHRGKIMVASEPGKGARFTILLPSRQPASEDGIST